MILFHRQSLASDLKKSFIFLDTNIFILASIYRKEVARLFRKLKKVGCNFLTIPSVVTEYSRGANTIDKFNDSLKFVTSFAVVIEIEKNIENLKDAMVVLHRVSSKPEYTDFLLCLCLCMIPSAFLLTENHKHISSDIFERKHIVTLDTGDEIKNLGFYKLSLEKYNKASREILDINESKKKIDRGEPF